MNERKHYLDNIRWITLCFVIIYHVFYIFNSSGVVSNIGVTGIKELDSICVFIYPWIMCLLFVVSGVSTKYSLNNKTNKEFIKDRAKRILVPSVIGIFVYGWISGWTTNYYGDIFAGNGDMIPNPIKYIIYSLIGIGPLWYAHVLFIASLLIVLITKIDKKQKIDKLFNKINLPILFLLFLIVWGSSFILNTPVVTVYRWGIYLLMFILGYYIFSNDEIIEKLEKISIPLGIITLIIGIGPLWYAHVLFIASLFIVLIRKIDKKQRIDNLFNKINLPILFLLFLVVWGFSFILNTPVVTVYRWGIYLLMFILGYYVFSNDKIIENLEKISIPLGIITVIFGIVFTIKNYGVNFASNEFLTSIFTNVYIWLVILSAFGISKKYLDIKNKFTDYMNKNNFSFYVLHYTIQIVISFILVEYIKFDNFIFNYIILILGTIIILPLMTEILKRIPIVNRLLLGIVKK